MYNSTQSRPRATSKSSSPASRGVKDNSSKIRGKLKEGGVSFLNFCHYHSGLQQCPRTDWLSGIMAGQEINRHVHGTWKIRGWGYCCLGNRIPCMLIGCLVKRGDLLGV